MSSIPRSKFRCSSEIIVPGYNEYVRELHDSARSSYLLWKRPGKLRGDVTECDMRTSRLKFKYAFRQCRNNEEMMRLTLSLAHYIVKILWRFGRILEN